MLNGISRPIYVATEPVDMRKSFDGLAAIVKNHCHHDPLAGHLFVFINRAADRIKVLYWDNDGYALWYKRLEAGRFRLPVAIVGEGKRVALISTAQLAMILEGIEPVVVKKRKRFSLQNTT
jgi:Transposase and inactivated derivatives